MNKPTSCAYIALAVLWLAGCGGGEVSGGSSSNPPGAPPAPSTNGAAVVSWTAPPARVSGASLPISEIGGYRIYWGTSSTNFPNVIDIPDRNATEREITGLSPGTYYFRVGTYDTAGIEGPKSPVMSKQIQ
jgi:hypothetical protein